MREKCKIEASTVGGLDSKTFQACYEREAQMAAQDLAVIETGLAKNALGNFATFLFSVCSRAPGVVGSFEICRFEQEPALLGCILALS